MPCVIVFGLNYRCSISIDVGPFPILFDRSKSFAEASCIFVNERNSLFAFCIYETIHHFTVSLSSCKHESFKKYVHCSIFAWRNLFSICVYESKVTVVFYNREAIVEDEWFIVSLFCNDLSLFIDYLPLSSSNNGIYSVVYNLTMHIWNFCIIKFAWNHNFTGIVFKTPKPVFFNRT